MTSEDIKHQLIISYDSMRGIILIVQLFNTLPHHGISVKRVLSTIGVACSVSSLVSTIHVQNERVAVRVVWLVRTKTISCITCVEHTTGGLFRTLNKGSNCHTNQPNQKHFIYWDVHRSVTALVQSCIYPPYDTIHVLKEEFLFILCLLSNVNF